MIVALNRMAEVTEGINLQTKFQFPELLKYQIILDSTAAIVLHLCSPYGALQSVLVVIGVSGDRIQTETDRRECT